MRHALFIFCLILGSSLSHPDQRLRGMLRRQEQHITLYGTDVLEQKRPSHRRASRVETVEDFEEEIWRIAADAPYEESDSFDRDALIVEDPAASPNGPFRWCVGRKPEQCQRYIRELNDFIFDMPVIPFGSPVTRDYRVTRVRIFVGENGRVVVPPIIG